MLRSVVYLLVALSLGLAGPTIAHAHHGVGDDGSKPCIVFGGTGGHDNHQTGHSDASKAAAKACCQAHCPNQVLVEPASTLIRLSVPQHIDPAIVCMLVGQSAPPDTPPPRL